MTEISHLPKAPISEALIDFKIKLKSDFEIKEFLAIFEKIKTDYPEKKEIHNYESRLEIKSGNKPLSENKDIFLGYRFESKDNKQIFQAKIDGFTFSRLNPYENWETMKNEALKMWNFYKEVSKPEIKRVAVRYINKIKIPMYPEPKIDFDEYLTAAPKIPKELPQGLISFFNKLLIPNPETEMLAIVTQAFEQIVDPKYCPIILDIDVFMIKDNFDNDEVWEKLDQMRNYKNTIFFSLITEKMKGLFL